MAQRIISESTPLLLGSASPRRREILAGLRIPTFVFFASAAEEKHEQDTPRSYLERVVVEKQCVTVERLRRHNGELPRFAAVLVADTIVVIDGDILGKPEDERHARELLSRLSGRTHEVHTRYAIAKADRLDDLVSARTVRSKVTMRSLDRAEVERYAKTGEGLDKAGAYAVQGIGAFMVESVHGSYTNVVGLPACEVISDLTELGLLREYP